MQSKNPEQVQSILTLLGFIEAAELFFAFLLFLLLTARAFHLVDFLGQFAQGAIFFVCLLFLFQSGVLYLVVYGYYRKSPYGRQMKLFLINLTVLPVLFIVAGILSFLLQPLPLIYRAYSLAFLLSLPLSYYFFRRMVSELFPSRA